MGLRSVLERSLPLKPGEVRLSKPARKNVFSGTYAFGREIIGIYFGEPREPRERQKHPHTLEVVRTRRNTNWDTETTIIEDGFKEPPDDIVNEMNNPAALKRARRIERAAREVKIIASTVVIAGGSVVAGLFAYQDNPSTAEHQPRVEACGDIVTGGETLVPIEESQVDHAQQLGKTVCSLSGHEYLVVPPSAQ